MATLAGAIRLLTTQLATVKHWKGPGPLPVTMNVDVVALELVLEDYAKLKEKTQCILGVGDGSGKLFVHGDYDSIKACQRLIDAIETMSMAKRYKDAMQEFCDRVDRGEVRSVKTYNQFKELLK